MTATLIGGYYLRLLHFSPRGSTLIQPFCASCVSQMNAYLLSTVHAVNKHNGHYWGTENPQVQSENPGYTLSHGLLNIVTCYLSRSPWLSFTVYCGHASDSMVSLRLTFLDKQWQERDILKCSGKSFCLIFRVELENHNSFNKTELLRIFLLLCVNSQTKIWTEGG